MHLAFGPAGVRMHRNGGVVMTQQHSLWGVPDVNLTAGACANVLGRFGRRQERSAYTKRKSYVRRTA
jgi:hypothetical protein